MVRLGNFLFKYRNAIFPLLFIPLVLITKPLPDSGNTEVLRYAIGICIALSGQIIRALTIGLAYIVRGGRNREVYADKLVKNGIFAHCRNPLYVGNILMVIGLAIVANSPAFYVIGIPIFLISYFAIIRAEEEFLLKKFGNEYAEYCRTVNRFLPKLSGISETIRGMRFNWARLIIKEYGTMYMWPTCVALLILRNEYLKYGHAMSNSLFISIVAFIIVLTVAYCLARYLKKSGKLVVYE